MVNWLKLTIRTLENKLVEFVQFLTVKLKQTDKQNLNRQKAKFSFNLFFIKYEQIAFIIFVLISQGIKKPHFSCGQQKS